MAMNRRASHLRLVAVDGAQVAPALRPPRGSKVRWAREARLFVIKEHLGYIHQSLERLRTLTGELETSLGFKLPDNTPWPHPDILNPNPPTPPELLG